MKFKKSARILPLLAALLVMPFAAHAEVSLFLKTPAEIEKLGDFDCQALPMAKKIQNLQSMCGSGIDDWKKLAFSLIDLPDRTPADASNAEKITAIVRRNTLITQAYAHLYLMSKNSFPVCGRSLLPWVGGASLGSLKSGQVMRTGMSLKAGGIEEFDRVEDGNYYDRFANTFTPPGAYLALEQGTLTLGDGNREIFKDLYWQLLAGATCGADIVVRTIENDPRGKSDPKFVRSLKVWKMIVTASQDCNPDRIILANRGFVEVEQYLVGQPVMYEGFTKQLGGRLLSPIIEAAVPAALGSFPTFMELSLQNYPSYEISFSNADQRVGWMKQQLGTMEDAFQSKSDLTAKMFCAVAQESETTRAFLDARK